MSSYCDFELLAQVKPQQVNSTMGPVFKIRREVKQPGELVY